MIQQSPSIIGISNRTENVQNPWWKGIQKVYNSFVTAWHDFILKQSNPASDRKKECFIFLSQYNLFLFSDNVAVERTSLTTPSNEDSFLPNYENQSKEITNSGKKKKSRIRRIKDSCNVDLLRRRLPIVGWLPNYNLNYSVFDLIAGVTVGLTIIPQSIAYAGVAGLPFEVLI